MLNVQKHIKQLKSVFGQVLVQMAKATSEWSEKMKLLLALIALQFCFAGSHIVSRVALNIGISKIVYPIYRNIIALTMLAPCAYFLEKKERPPLTFSLLVQFFLLALIGITGTQGFYILGLYYASPTFASAMQNSVPAITFLLAVVLRIEHANILRRDGLAKVFGTLASVGGATVITLYKGLPILNIHLTGSSQESSVVVENTPLSSDNIQSWNLGCIFLLAHCLCWAAWIVVQAPVLKKYPAKLSMTSFTCFFGLIQFVVIAAFAETDLDRWRLRTGEELCTILYGGIVSSGIVISLQTWCIHKGGPVFVAVFQPVQTLLVAIMATLILGDQLFSGGIIGAVLIVIGLYLVLWGKSNEKREAMQEKDDEEQLRKHLLGDSEVVEYGNETDIP